MFKGVTPRERRWMAISLVLALALLLGGRELPEVSAKDGTQSGLLRELKTFTDVISIVQRDYVKEVEGRKIVEGAIKGMLATLDPHSGYLDPDFYQDLQVQTKGEFGGLGIEITIRDGVLVVVSPMEGSPAATAGIKPGDEIVKIEGKFTKEFSLVDAVKRLRGPKGSAIVLSIQRKGVSDLIDVKVVRDNIQVKSVASRYLGDGYGYVRVSQFMERTTEDLKRALARLKEEHIADVKARTGLRPERGAELRGLVLDMRNNPGGLLTQAIGVSDLFLREGIIVYTDGRMEGQRNKYYAREAGTEPDYPIVVLVNAGSASAAEIVAGALKDHGRALVLGNQTFGKGSVQTVTPLDNGGALTLTTALYYTKSGRSIQVTGVKPDIDVPDTRFAAAVKPADSEEKQSVMPKRRPLRLPGMREGDLPGAIDNPSGDGTKDELKDVPSSIQPPDYKPIDIERDELNSIFDRDEQLARAFELLKTFNIFAPSRSGEVLAGQAGVVADSATN